MTAYIVQTGDFGSPRHSGPYGNKSEWGGRYTPGAVKGLSASSDTVTVDVCELPAGSTVTGVSAVFSAIGTAATMDIGFRWKDTDASLYTPTGAPTPSATYWKSNLDVSAAGTFSLPVIPLHLPLAAVLTVTFADSSGTNIVPSTADVYVAATGISTGT